MVKRENNQVVQVCPQCGYKNVSRIDKFNKGERYFCAACGSFLNRDKLTDVSVAKLPEFKLLRILENMQYIPHSRILWNEVIDQYVAKVEKYKALYEIDDLKSDHRQDVSGKMEDFLNICCTSDFQIAFVGTIKTGKSTLINALLGKNYASMAVTPETAALTKFRSSERDYVKVSFYSSKEWNDLWNSISQGADAFMKEYNELKADKSKKKWIDHETMYKEMDNDSIKDEIKKWSSSTSPEHYFVKEIEVGISNLEKNFPKQVVFVDTPGLSDPVAYRSDITKKYIKQANAVFVCVDAQKMNREETETISSVFSFSHKNKNKVHIIATHWDSLNSPEEDWQVQREWMFKQLVGPAFFDDKKTAEANIMYSSAYIYNLCREFDDLDQRGKSLLFRFALLFSNDFPDMCIASGMNNLKACIPRIKEKTNIDNVKKIIKEHLISNYKEILAKEIEQRYEDIIFTLRRTVREGKKQSQDLIETAEADVSKRVEKIELQKKNYYEIVECKKRLNNALALVDARTKHNLDIIISKIDGQKTNPKKFVSPKVENVVAEAKNMFGRCNKLFK